MDEIDYVIRDADTSDIAAITDLILTHGPNEWNHLPEEEVREHVAAIATERVKAVVADLRGELIGVVTYQVGNRYPQYQPEGREDAPHGYLAEAVTHREHAGHGIGTTLFRLAIQKLITEEDMREIYAMRHQDNIASGRMMKKSGMEIVDEFDDPEIRTIGSRRTTVTRIVANV